MKRIIISFTLMAALSVSWAQNLEFKISSMGMRVAKLKMSVTENSLYVKASNSGMRTIFPHINNSYSVQFKNDYLPLRYNRIIHQDTLKDTVLTTYENGGGIMRRSKAGTQPFTYPLPPQSRDFFSLIWKICKSAKATGEYVVDGNGRTWKAIVSGGDIDNISTPLGKFQATRYQLKFKPITAQKAEYVDMLTHNFLDESITLLLWVNQGGIPVKAHLKKKLMGMHWEIESISQ